MEKREEEKSWEYGKYDNNNNYYLTVMTGKHGTKITLLNDAIQQ